MKTIKRVLLFKFLFLFVPLALFAQQDLCIGTQDRTYEVTGGDAGTTYTWTLPDGGGSFDGSASGVDLTNVTIDWGNTAGTYRIQIQESGLGCAGAVYTYNVILHEKPTVTWTGSEAVCAGETNSNAITLDFTGSGSYNFTYSINGTNQSVITTIDDPYTLVTVGSETYAANSTYSLVSISDDYCTSGTQSGGDAIITVNPLPTVTLAGAHTVCEGASADMDISATFTGASPFDFNWTDGSEHAQTNENSPFTFVNSGGGTFTANTTYQITSVTDANGCTNTTNSNTVTVTVNPLPTVTLAGAHTVCEGASADMDISATFTGASPFDFNWTDGSGHAQTNENSPFTFVNSGGGTFTANTTYQITSVTDANGCTNTTNSNTVTVTVNPLPTATLASDQTVCSGNNNSAITVTLTGTGATWDLTLEKDDGTPSNSTITDITDGGTAISPTAHTTTTTYTITEVTDDGTGCTNTTNSNTVTVTVPVFNTLIIAPTN